MLHALPGLNCQRVLLVSLGAADSVSDKSYRDAVVASAKIIASGSAEDAAFCLADTEVPGRDMAWKLNQAARLLEDATYRFELHKTKKSEHPGKGARKLVFVTRHKLNSAMETAITRGRATAEGMALTRISATSRATSARRATSPTRRRSLASEFKLKVEVLERAEMEKAWHALLLSVAKGSVEPPKLIVMQYKGGKAKDKTGGAGRQRASPSTPAASRSNRAPKWTR